MKAVTFNIRCDIQPKSEAEFREMLASLPDGVKAPAVRFPKGDGVNAWELRKALDVRAIRRASPEVVGFQEILPHMGLYLRRELPGYTFLGHGREKDYGGERPMVAVREDVEILAYRCSGSPPRRTNRVPASRSRAPAPGPAPWSSSGCRTDSSSGFTTPTSTISAPRRGRRAFSSSSPSWRRTTGRSRCR